VIGAADRDVEREVEALVEQDEEGQGEEQEERSPLAETSANVRRVVGGPASVCDAPGRGCCGAGGRGTGRGRRSLHDRSLASVSRLVFSYRSYLI